MPIDSMLVSAAVVESSGDRRFMDLGEIALKGFAQPVRAYAIGETR